MESEQGKSDEGAVYRMWKGGHNTRKVEDGRNTGHEVFAVIHRN